VASVPHFTLREASINDPRLLAENQAAREPEFAMPFAAAGYYDNIQPVVTGYDRPRPGERVSRWARMPRWFRTGIAPITSVAAWPNLPTISPVDRRSWTSMTGVQLPAWAVGWAEPKRNIVNNPSESVGNLTAIYPRIYAATDAQ